MEKQCPRAGWTDSVLRAGGRAPFVRIGLLRNSKCLYGLKLELRSHWAYKKVRYKGLEKNTAQLHTLFALANLMIAKRRLLALDGLVPS